MKIVFIIVKGLPYGGGIEKYTEEVGSRLVRSGHKIIVYSMARQSRKPVSYRGMLIKPIPTPGLKTLDKMVASLLASICLYFEDGVDMVHYHAFGPAMFVFIPRMLGIKTVVQGHSLEWKRARWNSFVKFFLKITEVLSVKYANSLTVVSTIMQRYLKDKYGKDSIFIPTGVNPTTNQKPDLIKQFGLHGNDYIFFAGRLVREKGAHYLIEAYKKLRTDFKLVIAGDEQYEKEYKGWLHKLAQGDKRIIFTGFVNGKILEELFSNCYIFVLPSEVEGLPTVLLEAMCYGNCCLVSDIPENRDPLNSLGYTFKNGDINDLAKKMQYLIENNEAVIKIKQSTKSYVLQNYSWDKIAQQLESLYYKLVSTKGG